MIQYRTRYRTVSNYCKVTAVHQLSVCCLLLTSDSWRVQTLEFLAQLTVNVTLSHASGGFSPFKKKEILSSAKNMMLMWVVETSDSRTTDSSSPQLTADTPASNRLNLDFTWWGLNLVCVHLQHSIGCLVGVCPPQQSFRDHRAFFLSFHWLVFATLSPDK